MIFYGRRDELSQLEDFSNRKLAGLVILKGRRRIGKSRLIQELGKNKLFKHYFEIQGLPPKREDSSLLPRGAESIRLQLDNFAEQISEIFQTPNFNLENWTQAFDILAKNIPSKGKTLVFLDEISWMAYGSEDFAGKLKIAWDKKLKLKNNLILVLCGSVSSWMEKNIFQNAGFVGRSSYKMTLGELPLCECNLFWDNKKERIAEREKLRVLMITGGVPRYLEEIKYEKRAEINIKNLAFNKNGIFFNEFDEIFHDIFGARSINYKKIILELIDGRKTFSELSFTLKKTNSGNISEYLEDLRLSGFIERDYSYTSDGRKSKISKFRLSDNYLRFYLRYIYPKKDIIADGLYQFTSLELLPGYDIIMGIQFENLVLNNKKVIIEKLNIKYHEIKSASPHFQNKTKRCDACQIDLLIHTKYSIYLCEIKFKNKINNSVVEEVRDKLKKLVVPKNISVRPVLIYAGELDLKIEDREYFDEIICFDDLLQLQ